ncbi:MAG: hypothetical protein AAFP19_08950 [Bacteroidota bacterium]
MLKNVLVQLIKTFQRKEMTRFWEFAQSPYHNKHQDVKALVAYLNQIYPNFSEETCNRQTIFQRLFPNKKHDQAKLALLFTYTRRLVEQFLILERSGEESIANQLLLLRDLRQRKQYKYYERAMRQINEQQNEARYRDGDYFRQQFLAASEANSFYGQLSQHKMDDSLQRKQNHLDHYYLSEKLRDACEMLVRSRILKVEHSTGLLDMVLRQVEAQAEEYLSVPAISIYYQLYQLILTKDQQRYEDLVGILDHSAQWFPKGELQNIYHYLQNYCIEQINKGSRGALEAAFELYKKQLTLGLLTDDDNYLSEWHYKNIVTIGLRLEEQEWIRWFLEDYRQQLRPESAENAYCFNLATYHYSKGQYDEVLELLLRLEHSDIRYQLDSKAMLLRTYYDLDEYEAFLSLVDAFQQFIHRNKLISDFQRRGYAHLLKFARRAFRIKNNIDLVKRSKSRAALQQLTERVEATRPIYNLSWLNGQIDKMRDLVVD